MLNGTVALKRALSSNDSEGSKYGDAAIAFSANEKQSSKQASNDVSSFKRHDMMQQCAAGKAAVVFDRSRPGGRENLCLVAIREECGQTYYANDGGERKRYYDKLSAIK